MAPIVFPHAAALRADFFPSFNIRQRSPAALERPAANMNGDQYRGMVWNSPHCITAQREVRHPGTYKHTTVHRGTQDTQGDGQRYCSPRRSSCSFQPHYIHRPQVDIAFLTATGDRRVKEGAFVSAGGWGGVENGKPFHHTAELVSTMQIWHCSRLEIQGLYFLGRFLQTIAGSVWGRSCISTVFVPHKPRHTCGEVLNMKGGG